MKKIKLIVPILTITTLSSALIPLVGCSFKKSEEKGSVELSTDVQNLEISLQGYSIKINEESWIILSLPCGKAIDTIEITVGNSTLKATDVKIEWNKITIPADKMIDNKVTIKSITFSAEPFEPLQFDVFAKKQEGWTPSLVPSTSTNLIAKDVRDEFVNKIKTNKQYFIEEIFNKAINSITIKDAATEKIEPLEPTGKAIYQININSIVVNEDNTFDIDYEINQHFKHSTNNGNYIETFDIDAKVQIKNAKMIAYYTNTDRESREWKLFYTFEKPVSYLISEPENNFSLKSEIIGSYNYHDEPNEFDINWGYNDKTTIEYKEKQWVNDTGNEGYASEYLMDAISSQFNHYKNTSGVEYFTTSETIEIAQSSSSTINIPLNINEKVKDLIPTLDEKHKIYADLYNDRLNFGRAAAGQGQVTQSGSTYNLTLSADTHAWQATDTCTVFIMYYDENYKVSDPYFNNFFKLQFKINLS